MHQPAWQLYCFWTSFDASRSKPHPASFCCEKIKNSTILPNNMVRIKQSLFCQRRNKCLCVLWTWIKLKSVHWPHYFTIATLPTKGIQDTTVTWQTPCVRHICYLFHPYSGRPAVSTVNSLIASTAFSWVHNSHNGQETSRLLESTFQRSPCADICTSTDSCYTCADCKLWWGYKTQQITPALTKHTFWLIITFIYILYTAGLESTWKGRSMRKTNILWTYDAKN